MKKSSFRVQLFRYAVVGQLSNILLYGAYLLLTWLGVEPKIAMTLVYAVGVVQTFFFNKHWSFSHRGVYGAAFTRYCLAYALGYAMNFFAFLWMVDRLKYPHQLVQAVMIIVVAATLFLLQRYWVFPQSPRIDRS